MINSVNTLDIIKPKLLNMDKFNATSATRLHHHHASLQHTNPTRAYLTFVTKSSAAVETAKPPTTLMGVQPQRQERVKVQHLENHTKLQNNNCWNNFRTLYNLSASSTPVGSNKGMTTMQQQVDEKVLDLEADDMQQRKIDIQNKSAFNIEFNKRNIYNNSNYINNTNMNSLSAAATETNSSNTNNNNNHFYAKHQENVFINREQPHHTTMMVLAPATNRRTEDQEHAYRRIESVHNYAKLKTYDDEDEDQSPNGSRHSSYMDDEEDEDEDEDDDDDDEEDNVNDVEYEAEEDEMIDLDADYEHILNRRRFPKISTSSDGGGVCRAKTGKEVIKSHNYAERFQTNQSAQQNEDDIDVETVEHQNTASIGIEMNNSGAGGGESSVAKPDHHARRPMNAFLIFCKRHRAIVKERYKTLENRAITKILGDWWASLDANDKNCFTNLAQQNKDAFFSANPNFKWYKLPAPPLRTLNTRPTNGGCNGGEYDDTNLISKTSAESISNNTRSSTNYFKLADEAQMGDLSQLMQDKSRSKQCALQQALGETSQFMSTHLTGNEEVAQTTSQPRQLKRHLYNENSISSNSSEEDGLVPKKKSDRSCKGKIYQELINSGQIAAPAIKKTKSSQRLVGEPNMSPCLDMDMRHKLVHNEDLLNVKNATTGAVGQRRLVSESDNMFSYDFATFDLEEKIKELPALCLDDYLQRKRNTKKKKKFSSNGKKRGVNRNSNSNCSASQCNKVILSTTSQSKFPLTDQVPMLNICIQQRKQQQQAVGSQKRKARKESITRRDVSAIEQEVASLLPLTINGCCYFQEAPLSLSPTVNSSIYNNDVVQKDTNTVKYFRQTSPIIPLITTTTSITSPLLLSSPSSASASTLSSTSSSLSPSSPQQSTSARVEMLNETLNDNISSTSDLLILAEVAANRTELER